MTKKPERVKELRHSTPSPERILAVDDRVDNLVLLREILLAEGYEVEIADNGADALKKIETNPPDLLLLDLKMPDVDGCEIIQQIRQNKGLPFIPILLMTAHESTYVLHALGLGANGYLSLPFDIDELLVKTRLFIQLKRKVISLIGAPA